MSRPTSIQVGPLVCRVHRPPIQSDPRWSWRITTRGRDFAILDSGRWTEEEVQRRAAEIIANRQIPPPRSRRKGVPETIGDLLAAYADATYVGSTRHAESTLANVKRCMRNLRSILGDIPLAGVSRDTIARYVREREGQGRASSTIVKEWVVLAQAWKYGRESLWVTGSLPDHGIRIVKPVYNHRTPTDEEIRLVHALLVTQANRRSNGANWPWLALEIADETGARVGEIGRLRVGDFDPAGRLAIRGKRTRSNPSGTRVIRIDEGLVCTLRQWYLRCGRPDPEEPLLGVRGKILRSRGRDKLAAACRELGIEVFTWHGVRRRVVRRLRRAGVYVRAASEYLGHSAVVMLRVYDEISEDDMEEELARLWAQRRT